jgi:hypothetical protein
MEEPNPSGLCVCGCGQRTELADQTRAARGWIKGKPKRYVAGHHLRGRPAWSKGKKTGLTPWNKWTDVEEPNPSGLCQCGCGQRTALAPQSSKLRGWVADKPVRFIPGHQAFGRSAWNKGLTRETTPSLVHAANPIHPYKVTTTHPDHPLATIGGKVAVHRFVLYEKIGPGPHNCHWCGKTIHWATRRKGEKAKVAELVVDHLDDSQANNAPDNLVPSCHNCNSLRGRPQYAITEEEPFVVWKDGSKHRATQRICHACGREFLIATVQLTTPKAGPRTGWFCSKHCARVQERRSI